MRPNPGRDAQVGEGGRRCNNAGLHCGRFAGLSIKSDQAMGLLVCGSDEELASSREVLQAAQRFAGHHGIVWQTSVPVMRAAGVKHIGRSQLLQLLRGTGKGDAA